MSPKHRLKLFLGTVVAAAAIVTVAALIKYPPPASTAWLLAFATLLALAILSALLALKITEGGSTTAMDFVPQLGAVLLLGPAGAIALTTIEQLFTEFLLLKKPYRKALFNTAQVVLSVAAASVLYLTFGGTPGLEQLRFTESFPPFLVGVLGYFAVNTVLVSYAIALTEEAPFIGVWRRAAGGIIVFDVVMSPLAYVVAYLYVQWGPVALLSAIIPIIGLRYSYGVNIELQQLSQDLLRVLIRTLEARDKYTSGHSLRVSERSRRIATALRLKPRQTRLIETAALLHDIGKIDMAYGEILRQAGPLTPQQRALIRTHPDKGVEIIGAARAIDEEVLRCVRHHHEWFDGSGYPSGLAGDDIPIGARIIMICDSIDAMVTDRPYRAALSVDEVRQELTRNAGTQFDPQVVVAVFATGILEAIEAPPMKRMGGSPTAAGTARV
jgi:putative nucleotidyltransferase with HDIG domain